jgi:ZIP family zinc transporter/zinc and cadmium transporter
MVTPAASASLWLVCLLGLLASGSNLLGGLLAVIRPRVAERQLLYGLAFSGGFLLAVALLDILPECVHLTTAAPLLILGGYFLVYLAEHLFAGHAHHFLQEPHGAHPLIGAHLDEHDHQPIRLPAAAAAAVGLLLHSFFDGAAIAAALGVSRPVGWLTFCAVVLHKIPEGFSLAAIMLASSRTPRTAVILAGSLGLSSLAGTLITALAAREIQGVEPVMLSIAAGMFLHIAATDLLPTTSQVRGLRVLAATLSGAAAVAVLMTLLRAV